MIETAAVAVAESRVPPPPAATEPTKNDFQTALKQAGEEVERAASPIKESEKQKESKKPEESEKPEVVQETDTIPLELLSILTPQAPPEPVLPQPKEPVLPQESPTEVTAREAPLPVIAPAKEPETPAQTRDTVKDVKPPPPPPPAPPPEPTLTTSAGTMTQVKQGIPAEIVAPPRGPIPPSELPEQLAYFAQRVGEAGQSEIHIRLDPPALGQIRVVLEHGKEGISVRIVAQTQETLLLLQNQRAPLHQELSRQNIQLESFSASLAGDTGGQHSNPRGFSTPSRVSREEGVPSAERAPLIVRLPSRIGGLDARA